MRIPVLLVWIGWLCRRGGLAREDVLAHVGERLAVLLLPGSDPDPNSKLDLQPFVFHGSLNIEEDEPKAPRVGKVDIVVRREHPQLEEIRAMVEANKELLSLALEPAEISNRITRCHFAITSGSGWSLELACVGVPQLLLLQNEMHWPNAQRLEDEGAASVLGWHENVSAQTIRQGVQNLIADAMDRKSMARCGCRSPRTIGASSTSPRSGST